MVSKRGMIVGVATMLLALIAIGSYLLASGGAGVWNGKALSVTFSDGTNNITSSVDIQGQRLRFDILMDDGRSMMTILSANGLNWTEFITRKEKVGNVTYEFVAHCKVLEGEDAEMLPPPSFFFPDEGDRPAVTANGSKFSVAMSDDSLVSFDLQQGFLSDETVSVRENGKSNMSLTSYDFSALSADAFQLPRACNGVDEDNQAVMMEFHSASAKQFEADLNISVTSLSSNSTRRLSAPWECVAGTNYCGGGCEGGNGAHSTRNEVDKCCAFHDFQCGYNHHDTGYSLGASNSARRGPWWWPGQHKGKSEHCSCAGALQQCSLVALYTDLYRGDWEGFLAGVQVYHFYSWVPCWFDASFCIPYPCGIRWCGRWWWRHPCGIDWCCWNIKFTIPTFGGQAPPYHLNKCTNHNPVKWTEGKWMKESNCNAAGSWR